jgi:DNA repair protein RecN (Recombination protein N)
MLIHLSLEHFLLIDQLELDFNPGMVVLTGETGAGKSVLCDALGLVLGSKADKSIIQLEQSRCTIKAQFDIQSLDGVKQWLKQRKYLDGAISSNHSICDIKRVIPRSGSAQAWVNGKLISIQDLKYLGQLLVNIHAQHDQRQLVEREYQRQCLDKYGQYFDLSERVETLYTQYVELKKQKQALIEQINTQQQQLALLDYQLKELEELQFQPDEIPQLDQEQRRLAHAQSVLENGHAALALMSESESVQVISLLHTIQQYLQKMSGVDNRFDTLYASIQQTVIQLLEIDIALRHTLGEVNINPERLHQVDQRLAQLHALARKHHISVEALPSLMQNLTTEREKLTEAQHTLLLCEQALNVCLKHYQEVSQALSQKRHDYAQQFQKAVTDKIQSLGMEGGQFIVRLVPLETLEPTRFGRELVEFHLSAAPGQPYQSLARGPSGGELSRLSLVVQMLIAESISVPTLIFDEVDVGVSGGVAERVGRLLQNLSHTHQVICITHLPQVAALGQHHYQVVKYTQEGYTRTKIHYLKTEKDRVSEMARLLGGIDITDHTIAHAQAMLSMHKWK